MIVRELAIAAVRAALATVVLVACGAPGWAGLVAIAIDAIACQVDPQVDRAEVLAGRPGAVRTVALVIALQAGRIFGALVLARVELGPAIGVYLADVALQARLAGR